MEQASSSADAQNIQQAETANQPHVSNFPPPLRLWNATQKSLPMHLNAAAQFQYSRSINYYNVRIEPNPHRTATICEARNEAL